MQTPCSRSESRARKRTLVKQARDRTQDRSCGCLAPAGLPAAIERSRKRLVKAHAELDVATRPQRSVVDKKGKRKADRRIDNAWSATFDWLTGARSSFPHSMRCAITRTGLPLMATRTSPGAKRSAMR
jgi:hypothetical protein